MGRQIEFYMTFIDEQEFLDSINFSGKIKIIYNTFKEADIMHLSLITPVGADIYDSNLSIYNSAIQSNILYNYNDKIGLYNIDLMESEVVQFNRCISPKSWLQNGRLWFEERTKSGKKRDEFLEWAMSLILFVKRKYSKWSDGRFVGFDAKKNAQNGELILGPPLNPI